MSLAFARFVSNRRFLGARSVVKWASLAVFLAIFSLDAHAGPASPFPIQATQPDDKTTFPVRLKGDERLHWAETLEGYTVVPNKNGVFEFAKIGPDGSLVPSGIRVGPNGGGLEQIPEDAKPPKGLKPSANQ